MLYCTNCGSRQPEDANFCNRCGARLTPVSRSADTTGSSGALFYDHTREMEEAKAAGQRALNSLYAAQNELRSARNWGIVDLVGGGFISTLVKQSKISNAQSYMTRARQDLHAFSDELDDVRGLTIEVDDFLDFADWFFDSFVVDFMVQDKINTAARQVQSAIDQVEDILRRL